MIDYSPARKAEAFNKCLELVLAHEGGFVDHPKDPGGPTNFGITQRVYDSYRSSKSLEPQSVEHLTHEEVKAIYANQYWKRVGSDYLPPGIDYAAFDYSVNSGVSRAVKDLQKCVGATVDGIIGVETIDQVCTVYKQNPQALIEKYCNMRMEFMRSLSTWSTFGKGWRRRVVGDIDGFQDGDFGVLDIAVIMAKADVDTSALVPAPIGSKEGEVPGKASERSISVLKSPGGIATASIGAGLSGQTVIAAIDQVQPYIDETTIGRVALVIFLSMIVVGAGIFVFEYIERKRGRL